MSPSKNSIHYGIVLLFAAALGGGCANDLMVHSDRTTTLEAADAATVQGDSAPGVNLGGIELSKINPKRLLIDRYSYLAQPYSFYYLHHIDHLGFKTDRVQNSRRPLVLDEARTILPDEYTFKGKRYSFRDYFDKTFALGFLVVHKNTIQFEKYTHESSVESKFLSNSTVKPMIAAMVGMAIEDGKIKSENDPVVKYLPQLSHGAYRNVIIRQLLEMSSGVAFNENYLEPTAPIHAYVSAILTGKPTLSELAINATSSATPGTKFEYKSVDTQVLAMLLEKVFGMPLNKVADKLWQQIGAENDAYFFRYKDQPEIPAAGAFCGSIRDFARFGIYAMKHFGEAHNLTVPSIRNDFTQPKPIGPDQDYYNAMGFGNNWWTIGGPENEFATLGIYGQTIYINPARQVVIVQTSAWPEPDPPEFWNESLSAMATIARQYPLQN